MPLTLILWGLLVKALATVAQLSDFEEENLSKAWNNEAPTKAGSLWVQLHVGDPGEACTANVAKETKRVKLEIEKEGTGWVNKNVLEWAAVAKTEKVTHFSVWDAEAAGNPRIYDPLTVEEALTEGKDARIKVGKLKLSLA